ncbi:hypothetical protein Glove_541g21 [Diversispora epigaea]|uniref:Uncharacterized protein n=1 Tax=Diversispora epigaea TaxID=1348612 RepID=A0A397GCT9_9GLOM|nr:hypothetical protein Glove_541g21 [Diversispora epigaea]
MTKVFFKLTKIKTYLLESYARIAESKWTRAFIITSIIQSLITIIFEALIISRNQEAANQFQKEVEVDDQNSCIKNASNRINNIYGENIVNQNSIQIITIAVINYLTGLFAIIQIVEIKIWKNSTIENCSLEIFKSYDLQIGSHEALLIGISLICATLMGFFSIKLYQAFGWQIYTRIGADLKMRIMSIEACFTIENGGYVHTTIYYIHVIVTLSIIFLQWLAYHSLSEESHIRMKIFICLWMITILDFIILLVKSTQASSQDSWYFFIVYITSGIVMAILTLIWAIIVLKNFGKGLKRHVSTQNSLPSYDINDAPSIQDPATAHIRRETSTRWVIDDD